MRGNTPTPAIAQLSLPLPEKEKRQIMDAMLPRALDARAMAAIKDLEKEERERDIEARVWLGIAITALLVVLSAGLYLRFGPIIHFKGEIKGLNRGGKDRIRW